MTRAVGVGVCLGVLLATAAAAQSASGVKIGYINSHLILQQTPGYAAAESTFRREYQGYQDELQKMSQQLDSSVRAYDQQSIALSPAAKQAREKDLQTMQQRMQQRSQELQQKAQQREQELLQPIQQRVDAVIKGIRAEGNYSIIFDADTPGTNIVAADPALDLTSRVIERLKRSQ